MAALEHADGSAASALKVTNPDGSSVWIPSLIPCTEDVKHLKAQRDAQNEIRSNDITEALEILKALDKGSAKDEAIFKFGLGEEVLSTFKRRLDLKSPFILGHSFGGATVMR